MTLVTNPGQHQNRRWKEQSNKENSLIWTYYNIKIITTFTIAININSIKKKKKEKATMTIPKQSTKLNQDLMAQSEILSKWE